VAHEVNTPVGVSLTAASYLSRRTQELLEALESGKIGRSTFTEYLKAAEESAGLIEKNAQRAGSLIQSFKKVAVDQTSGERRRFNLGGYLEEVALSLGPELRRCNASVAVDPKLNEEIDSYPGALSQVVTNLVMNSLIHGFAGRDAGAITMTRCDAEDEMIAIIYADDGVGLSAEAAQRIFDPFFTTARGLGGSGLGMHIVYNLVTGRLGGEISVIEDAEGPGARFRLSLPLTAPDQR